jgi:hypothetical protein
VAEVEAALIQILALAVAVVVVVELCNEQLL